MVFSEIECAVCQNGATDQIKRGIRFGKNSPILGRKRQDKPDPPPIDLPDSLACRDLQISDCAAHRTDRLTGCLIQIVSSPLAHHGMIFMSAPKRFLNDDFHRLLVVFNGFIFDFFEIV